MISPFIIQDHTFEGQHIREYPRALASSQEDIVRLHAKSYTPKEVEDGPAAGDLTIIAFHANAIQKEVYEPFFETLYHCLKKQYGLTISSIWIADQASQGTSALLNDQTLANDPSWFDHSRDVLAMINAFRKHMKRPIVAIGHSMGGAQALAAAQLHPRLFETVVMIDAVISMSYSPSINGMLQYALRRPDTYPTKEQAESALFSSPLFTSWDKQVLQRHVETALHSSPTVANPDATVKPTTTKYAEAATLGRPNIDHVGARATSPSNIERAVYPNVDPTTPLTGPIHNPYPRQAYQMLPTLRPSALFLNGADSRVSRPEEVEERTKITGTAPGGSGGVEAGKVAAKTVPGGHFLPMTNVEGTAEAVAEWLKAEMERYRETERELAQGWSGKNVAKRQRLDPNVERTLRSWDGKPWDKPKAGQKSRL